MTSEARSSGSCELQNVYKVSGNTTRFGLEIVSCVSCSIGNGSATRMFTENRLEDPGSEFVHVVLPLAQRWISHRPTDTCSRRGVAWYRYCPVAGHTGPFKESDWKRLAEIDRFTRVVKVMES